MDERRGTHDKRMKEMKAMDGGRGTHEERRKEMKEARRNE